MKKNNLRVTKINIIKGILLAIKKIFLLINKIIDKLILIYADNKCFLCNNKDKVSSIFNFSICFDCLNKIIAFHDIKNNCNFCYHPLPNNFIYNQKGCSNCSHLFTNKTSFFVKNISLLPLDYSNRDNIIEAKYYKNDIYLKYIIAISNYIFSRNDHIVKYFTNCDFITCVPISFRKKILRAYSLPQIYSKFLSKKFNKKVYNIFTEKGLKYTHLKKESRFEIDKDRYFLKKNKLKKLIQKFFQYSKELKIIIIDDIFTTGSTINYLSELLESNIKEILKELNINEFTINIYAFTIFRKVKNS
ncbi:MAG: hypothetical protein N3A58_05270 [Spirochaetes bacterium]|nr:hypothetical protein [Spirochaetota bacterium]